MNGFEEQETLAQELRYRSQEVGGHPITLDSVKRTARSIRRRQRVAGGLATLAVLAISVPAGLAIRDGLRDRTGEAVTGTSIPSVSVSQSTPTPSSSTTATAGEADPMLAWANQLPLGPALALGPHTERRGAGVVLVLGDQVVALPGGSAAVAGSASSRSGTVVAVHSDAFTGGGPDATETLYLVRSNGTLVTLHRGAISGLAVSPSGLQCAFAAIGSGALGEAVEVSVIDLPDGALVTHRSEPAATEVAGWTTGGVLLIHGTTPATLWAPGKIPTTLAYDSVLPVADDPDRLVVESGRTAQTMGCLHLLTVSSDSLGPEVACGMVADGVTVSPDGSRAIVAGQLFDLVTGKAGPAMPGPGAEAWLWEDSTHAYTWAIGTSGQRQVYVRCDVLTTSCERTPVNPDAIG